MDSVKFPSETAAFAWPQANSERMSATRGSPFGGESIHTSRPIRAFCNVFNTFWPREVRRFSPMDTMRSDVQRAFGYPKFWQKNNSRLQQFLDEILPTAAGLRSLILMFQSAPRDCSRGNRSTNQMAPESAGCSRVSGVTRRCCSQARVRRSARKVRGAFLSWQWAVR